MSALDLTPLKTMLSLLIAPLSAAPLFVACTEAEPVDPLAALSNAAQPGTQQGALPGAQAKDPEIPKCEGDQLVTPSGLKYCFLEKGEGNTYPGMGDTVRVDYTGWTMAGKVFDSSRRARFPGQEPQPAEFQLGMLIDGWNEMLQLMVPGDRVLVTIPSNLAYGEKGAGSDIPPNADLIFDFVLHAIVDEAPDFVAWPAAESEAAASAIKLDGGVELRVLAEGTGEALAEGSRAVFDCTAWTESGKFAFVHSFIQQAQMIGQWRTLTTQSQPLPFMKSLLPYVKAGAKLQVRVPSTLGIRSKFPVETIPEGANELWMIEVPSLRAFPEPEFRVPTDEELTTTESGLQYVIVREGNGRNPKATNTVLAHYSGWLTDGRSFDSSHQRKAPSAFPLNRVVPGWTEGLQLLKEGGAGIFVIPADLGYGNQSRGIITPGSTLVFYVDLLAVN